MDSLLLSFYQVVQFEYGEDNLDPTHMEGNEKPIDFPRLMNHIRSTLAESCRPEPSLSGEQVTSMSVCMPVCLSACLPV